MKSNVFNIAAKYDDLTALPKEAELPKRSRRKITAKILQFPNKPIPNKSEWENLNNLLVEGSDSVTVARVNDSSISGISPGDLIVINYNLPAELGDIVIKNNTLRIKYDADMEISGVVVCVIKSLPSHLRQRKEVSK